MQPPATVLCNKQMLLQRAMFMELTAAAGFSMNMTNTAGT
jgi:hypothetical protein